MVYGRVTVESLDEFLSATEAGDVDFTRLRGRARYPAHVQAAEAIIGVPGLKLVHVVGGDAAAQVTFASAQDVLKTSVRRARDPLLVLQKCAAEDPELVFPYLLG